MTPPRRRSRRLAAASTAAPSPATPPPTHLLDLPTELIARALSHCDPADIARVAAVSLLFHASLAVEGIRLWAQERGFELPAQPEHEGCAVRWLCFAAQLCESNPPARLAAAGESRRVFIDGEGRLSSCGSPPTWLFSPGLLGHGEGVTRLNTPTRLPSPLGGERAVSMSAASRHSLALTADGAVWSWGYGGEGRLGHGDEQSQPLPGKVEAFAGQRVVAVSAGYFHSLALTAHGAVWSWGWGASGRLGHGDEQRQLLPKKVEALAGQRVIAVSARTQHSLALTADGSVWSWGDGDFGRLGHGDAQHQLLPKKVEALGGQRVVAASAGGMHSLPHRRRLRLELGQWRLWQAGPRRRAGAAAAKEGRGLHGAARRRCVIGRSPQHRPHRRRSPLRVGPGRKRLPWPRRGLVEPAAAEEGRGAVGAAAGARCLTLSREGACRVRVRRAARRFCPSHHVVCVEKFA